MSPTTETEETEVKNLRLIANESKVALRVIVFSRTFWRRSVGVCEFARVVVVLEGDGSKMWGNSGGSGVDVTEFFWFGLEEGHPVTFARARDSGGTGGYGFSASSAEAVARHGDALSVARSLEKFGSGAVV